MASRNLLTLRAELEEQTKEIQKLQNEVEQATQHTIHQLSLSSHDKCHKNTVNDNNTISRLSPASSSSRGNHNVLSSASLQTLKSNLDAIQTSHRECGLVTQRNVMHNGLDGFTFPVDKHPVRKSLNDYSSLLINAQSKPEEINSMQRHHQYLVSQSVSELNLKVQELIKRNAEMDIRFNESKNQEDTNRQLQGRIQELETANGVQEEMLKQAHTYIDILKEMLQKRDNAHQDIQGTILTYINSSGKEIPPNCDLSNLGTFVVKMCQEMADEVSSLKLKLHTTEDKMDFLKKELDVKENILKQCKEMCDKQHKHEMAALNHELDTARNHAKAMQNQLETLQQQNSKHKEHIVHLESVVSDLRSELKICNRTSKDKVEELKKQLSLANSALEKTQNEFTQLSQDFSKQLQELIQLQEALKVCENQLNLERERNRQLQEQANINKVTNDHLRKELIERSMEVERLQLLVAVAKEESQQKEEEKLKNIQENTTKLNVMTCQMESMKAALQNMTEELAAKTQSLKNAEKNLYESKDHLAEKDRTLRTAVEELRKLRLYAEAKKKELQELKTTSEQMSEMLEDTETLQQLLTEKDNMIMTLRDQIQTLTRVVGQQNQKVGSLEAEKSQLLEEASQMNAVIHDNKVVVEKKDLKIHELEEMCQLLNMEKSKLANECIEKTCAANKLKKERKEILAELRETQNDLACLSEDYEAMQRINENRNDDKENATAILKMKLKAAVAELTQTKDTLKTVEECDGHAIKIATKMQKKITAKREHIDALQSRIQFLEESLSNATKEKRYLKLEKAKLLQECANQAEEKNRLHDAVEVLKSENKALKTNVVNTKATLDKTLMQLSDCQAVIQRLEQEITLLKLQHTLDVKELRGPFLHEIPAKQRQEIASESLQNDFPVHEYDLLSKSCPKVFMSTKPSVNFNIVEPSEKEIHLSDSLPCAEDEAPLKRSVKTDHTSTHNSKMLTMHTTDFEDKVCSSSPILSVSSCYTSPLKNYKSPEMRPRSPVYSLLTAPASDTDIIDTLTRNHLPETIYSGILEHGEQCKALTNSTCQIIQHRLDCLQTIAEDLQMKNKEMSLIIGNHENKC